MKRLIAVVLLMAIFILGLCSCAPQETELLNAEDIRAVCELATLKCYYNNVAQIEKKADNIFQKDRKMWIEYEGEVVIGIDMSQVVIEINGNLVSITMPNADIQSIKPREETLTEDSYVSSTDGWLVKNKITTEEQQAAIEQGQIEMERAVRENKELFLLAEDRAKELIENYITKIGEVTSREYTIEWKK